MLKVDGRKINYLAFVAERADEGLSEALDRLLPRIRQLDFAAVVDDVPYLGDLQRRFLVAYLTARRERIFFQ